MFGIILVSVITCLHLYVFGRVAAIPVIRRCVPLNFLWGLGLLLWGLFFLSRMLRHSQTSLFSGVMEFVGMGWMGTLFLIFVSLLTIDVLTLFGLLLPRFAPNLRGIALVLGIVLVVAAFVQGLRTPVVTPYSVALKNLPGNLAGLKIAAVSDMHLGTQLGQAWLSRRVDQVLALKPDMVVLLGDILDAHDGAMAQLIPVLSRLNAPLGVYAVLGNHEFYRGGDLCEGVLGKAGINVLRNRWIELKPGMILAGVDDFTAGRRLGVGGDFLSQALAKRPRGATILLSHTPWHVTEAAKADVGLMLSGHTHNGQIWPFNFLVRRVYPLIYGRYKRDDLTVIVSRGTGTWGPRMRLWRPGEILLVTLRTFKEENRLR